MQPFSNCWISGVALYDDYIYWLILAENARILSPVVLTCNGEQKETNYQHFWRLQSTEKNQMLNFQHVKNTTVASAIKESPCNIESLR